MRSRETAKKRHLVSSYAAVCHMLQQMEEAAALGRSPSGVGSPLTPLPPEATEPILAPVRELRDRLRAAAVEKAPAELADFERAQPPNNTFVWLSNLMARIRMALDDLQPARMARYGPVDDDERAALIALSDELMALLQTARSAVDGEMGE